jgi:hypothetical protein
VKKGPVTLRDERLAENQRLFRFANERLEGAVADRVGDSQRVPFLCECADDSCRASVDMTLAEYSAVRAHDGRFLIVPRHPGIEGEKVVAETDRFHVVEKPS